MLWTAPSWNPACYDAQKVLTASTVDQAFHKVTGPAHSFLILWINGWVVEKTGPELLCGAL